MASGFCGTFFKILKLNIYLFLFKTGGIAFLHPSRHKHVTTFDYVVFWLQYIGVYLFKTFQTPNQNRTVQFNVMKMSSLKHQDFTL